MYKGGIFIFINEKAGVDILNNLQEFPDFLKHLAKYPVVKVITGFFLGLLRWHFSPWNDVINLSLKLKVVVALE